MYSVRVIVGFNAAHRLREYKGKCENLHGHNWKVDIEVTSAQLENGMVIDFKELKAKANEVVHRLDHTYLNELDMFSEKNPTSENIAAYICENLLKSLRPGFSGMRVSVWETDTSVASYYKEI